MRSAKRNVAVFAEGEVRRLSTAFIKANVAANPTVFPLLQALTAGEVTGSGASLKRRISEWGERALLAATFAN